MDIITFTPFERAFFEHTKKRFNNQTKIKQLIDDMTYPGMLQMQQMIYTHCS